MQSRDYLVNQVAETIKKNHSKDEKASFIFGISGRWGEGKTTFLDNLEKKLKDFTIIRLNPWKFTGDRISFLRNFLSQLNPKENSISKFRNWLNNKSDLRKLYSDTTENSVHWGILIVLFLFLLQSVILYDYLNNFNLIPSKLIIFINSYYPIFAVIIIPILYAIMQQLILKISSSKTIQTLDLFDSLLETIIKKYNKNKIVIYVDDLDRVTPETARFVLDNLRTFFDKPQLTFVVTGDHTVLERYIGTQTLPNKPEPEQIEEGRRFLKKIFDVYWRLPLPINKDFNDFLDNVLSKKKSDLDSIFIEENSLKTFRNYLYEYFEKNYRQVIRFIDEVIFNFNIIKNQLSSVSKDKKPYFKELNEKPLLVIRMLLIQELCTPLYEEIARNPKIIGDLEYAVEKQDNPKIQLLLEPFNNKLSLSQKSFINKFIYEVPRFFVNNSLQVRSFDTFLYLNADESFGDARGISAQDFIPILKSSNVDEIKNNIYTSGKKKIEEIVKSVMTLINNEADINIKNTYLNSVISSLILIPKHSSHLDFLSGFEKLDLSFFNNLTPQVKVASYQKIWELLDLDYKDSTSFGKNNFAFTDINEFDYFTFTKAGQFTSDIICQWLISSYKKDVDQGINKMEIFLPKLNIDSIKTSMKELINVNLTDDLINDTDINRREKRHNIITTYSNEGSAILKTKILKNIALENQELWQWANNKLTEISTLWSEEELERALINKLRELNDQSVLARYIKFSNGKIKKLNKEFWEILIKNKVAIFTDSLPTIINDSYDPAFLPNNNHSKGIYKLLIIKIGMLLSEDEKALWIAYLDKSKWPWSNLQDIKERDFKLFSKSQSVNLSNITKQILISWNKIVEN